MTCFGKTGKRSHDSQFKKQPRHCDGRDITAACIATLWRYFGSCRVPRWLWPAVAAACGLTGNPPGQHAFRLFAAFSGVLERYGGIFPETEQLALAVKTVGHSPELASVGGNEKKQTAAVKILAGLHVGFQTADVGIGKRHGHSLAVVGRRDTHMDKNIFDSARLFM